jgi:hypothetical protein
VKFEFFLQLSIDCNCHNSRIHETNYAGKIIISDTGMHWLQDEMTQFMAQLPTDKALEIAMDYLANDEEVREYVAYFQSEEFPKIHKTVQHLNEYKDVSAPMCTCLKPQSDGENICSVSTGS